MAINILPINDIKANVEDSTCECLPKVTIQHGEMIICHNSFDGREIIEHIEELTQLKLR